MQRQKKHSKKLKTKKKTQTLLFSTKFNLAACLILESTCFCFLKSRRDTICVYVVNVTRKKSGELDQLSLVLRLVYSIVFV